MLEKYNIQKIEVMCEKHGKQVVNSFDINGKHCIGECPYCRDEDAKKRAIAELARMRTDVALQAIPLRFRVKSLGEYDTSDQEARKEAIQACWEIYYGDLSSLILIGGTGVGKTHLLTTTVKEALYNDKSARYVTEDDLLKELKESLAIHGSDSRVISRYISYDLLAIDEIGRGRQTEYFDAVLYTIISKRHESMRQTMLAGSLAVQELTSHYNGALLRRLMEDGKVIQLVDRYAG